MKENSIHRALLARRDVLKASLYTARDPELYWALQDRLHKIERHLNNQEITLMPRTKPGDFTRDDLPLSSSHHVRESLPIMNVAIHSDYQIKQQHLLPHEKTMASSPSRAQLHWNKVRELLGPV